MKNLSYRQMRKFLTAIFLLSLSAAYAGSYTYQQGGGMLFGWNASDEFALFTSSGTLMPHSVKAENVADAHYVTTQCVGWALVEQNTYYGAYPYSLSYKLTRPPYAALPIRYDQQTQTANDNTEHLATADYMTAQATSTADALSVSYIHLGSVMRIAAYVPETKTFTSLTLATKDNTAWFAAEATMNATNNTISATNTTDKATLTLDNITVEGGDSLIAYMMLPPTDITDRAITVTLNAADGSALQTYIAGTNIQAGRVYPVSIGQENYFRLAQPTEEDGDTPEVLSLQAGFEAEGNKTTAQITEATAYAPDFTADTTNKMEPFLLGDANLDGVVDVTDVVIVVNHFQNDTTDELDFNVADIDGDGVIDVTDVVGIVNIYQSSQQ